MLSCMRTTIRLDEDLLRRAKELAARTDRTLTAVIEDALREVIARVDEGDEGGPFRFPTFEGGGPLPGIDLDDNAGLLDVMEGET